MFLPKGTQEKNAIRKLISKKVINKSPVKKFRVLYLKTSLGSCLICNVTEYVLPFPEQIYESIFWLQINGGCCLLSKGKSSYIPREKVLGLNEATKKTRKSNNNDK